MLGGGDTERGGQTQPQEAPEPNPAKSCLKKPAEAGAGGTAKTVTFAVQHEEHEVEKYISRRKRSFKEIIDDINYLLKEVTPREGASAEEVSAVKVLDASTIEMYRELINWFKDSDENFDFTNHTYEQFRDYVEARREALHLLQELDSLNGTRFYLAPSRADREELEHLIIEVWQAYELMQTSVSNPTVEGSGEGEEVSEEDEEEEDYEDAIPGHGDQGTERTTAYPPAFDPSALVRSANTGVEPVWHLGPRDGNEGLGEDGEAHKAPTTVDGGDFLGFMLGEERQKEGDAEYYPSPEGWLLDTAGDDLRTKNVEQHNVGPFLLPDILEPGRNSPALGEDGNEADNKRTESQDTVYAEGPHTATAGAGNPVVPTAASVVAPPPLGCIRGDRTISMDDDRE